MTDHPSRRRLWIASGVLASLVLIGGATGSYAYAAHYDTRALPGVSVAGQPVTGMDVASIGAMLEQRAKDVKVEVTVEGEAVSASLADLGVAVDATATVDQAMAGNASFTSKLGALFSSRDVAPVVSVDREKLQSFADSLARKAGPVVVNASVSLDPETNTFHATEAVSGTGLDVDALSQVAEQAAGTLSSASTTAVVQEVKPEISTEEAQEMVAAAQALAGLEVSITDGIDDFAADAATRASWVKVPVSSDGKSLEKPVVDEAKLRSWVEKTAEETNVAPKPGINNVDANGKVLVEARKGVKGFKVNNADAVTKDAFKSLSEGKSFAGDFDYDEVEAPYESRQALPGAENALYPAAEGEKWLEINLGNNSVSAYVGLSRVHGPVPIVPGSPGHETVTGLFHIYLKYDKQDMGCTPEWPYCAKDVPWVSYFHGSYAFHGAPWQDSFGWSGPGGSHGCINMPVHEAKWVHQWSEMGTPVVSHY
ncbi:L,D-transpeptidase family protein [Schaalia sp. Marseille-Q2122]|uniref:L,D-transpeptidase family protein n=1 Tax=Schaalia sp. Marseille-Q2122 TaxID=2736604 RepID=UPI001588BB5D|nr:L,D-transpeptidase family protein [Schaalia sp. Marseille-Q2122]